MPWPGNYALSVLIVEEYDLDSKHKREGGGAVLSSSFQLKIRTITSVIRVNGPKLQIPPPNRVLLKTHLKVM